MAILYDLILVLSLLIISSIVYLAILGIENIKVGSTYFVFYQIYIVFLIYFYFIYFWLKSGQTVGMKVWRMKIVYQGRRQTSKSVKIMVFFLRIILAIISFLFFGLGFFSALFNNKITIYDFITKTRIVCLRTHTV